MTQKMLQSDFSRSDKNQNQSKLLPHVQAPHMTNDKSRSSLSIRLREELDRVEAASKPSSTRPQPTPSGSRRSTCQNQPQSLPHVQAPHMTNDKSRSSLSIRLRQQFDPVEAASKPSSTRPQPTPSGSRRSTCQNQPQSLPHVQAPQMTNDKSRSSLSIRLKQQVDPAEAASKRRSTRPQPIFSGPRNSKPVTSPVEAKKVPTNIDLSAIINYAHR